MGATAWGWGGLVPFYEAMLIGLLYWAVVRCQGQLRPMW